MRAGLTAAVIGAACLLCGAPAPAADSGVLAVTTSVPGTCKFTSGRFTMNFGALDPAAASNQTQSASLTHKCTRNVAATTFSFDGNPTSPASINITNGVDNIPVSLSWVPPATPGSGFGARSTAINMTVTGIILGSAYATVSAGAYTKNVAVTVSP